MSEQEFEPIMRRLIKLVVRSFYEPHHIVITDILLEDLLLSDVELCGRMKMLNREFSKLIIQLKDDRLIKSDIKVESSEDNRQILKNVYFFNYAETRDVIKYKIFKMTKALEVQKVSDDEAFYCSECGKYFSALDAQALIENYIFKCVFCRSELQECTHKTNDNQINLKDMLNELKDIIDLLKAAEKYEIPSIDYFQILEMKKEREREKNKECVKKDEVNIRNEPLFEDKVDNNSEEFNSIQTPMVENKTIQNKNQDLVTVNGIPKPFSQITDEDKEIMNEDEYTKYFEIYEKYNQ